MALDLSGVKQISEELMEDLCLVAEMRKVSSYDDLGVGATDVSLDVLRRDVPMRFRRQHRGEDTIVQRRGEDFTGALYYVVSMPLSEEEPQPGQVIVVTRCEREPESVGLAVVVVETLKSTFTVSRRIRARVAEDLGLDEAVEEVML